MSTQPPSRPSGGREGRDTCPPRGRLGCGDGGLDVRGRDDVDGVARRDVARVGEVARVDAETEDRVGGEEVVAGHDAHEAVAGADDTPTPTPASPLPTAPRPPDPRGQGCKEGLPEVLLTELCGERRNG